MVVSGEIAERLAEEAAERGTSPEDVAAEPSVGTERPRAGSAPFTQDALIFPSDTRRSFEASSAALGDHRRHRAPCGAS